MSKNIRVIAIAWLVVVVALVLSACSVAGSPANSRPDYRYGPGMMNGGTMGGGMMGGSMMGGGMMGGGMMGGYGYNPSSPTAESTPLGATPVPVDQEIQITAANARFTPAQITVRPGDRVRFVVTNNDPFLHNFVGQAAGIPFLNLPANSTQTVTWTAPVQTGTYTAVCTLHPGMSISIVVKK